MKPRLHRNCLSSHVRAVITRLRAPNQATWRNRERQTKNRATVAISSETLRAIVSASAVAVPKLTRIGAAD